MLFQRAAAVLLLAGLLVPGAWASSPGKCNLYQVWHYDQHGVLIDTEPFCMSTMEGCGEYSVCFLQMAGNLFWCQCQPSGELAECVSVAGTNVVRCHSLGCTPCSMTYVDWQDPESGHQYHQEWCVCP